MDVKAITGDRVRTLDAGGADNLVVRRLHAVAEAVYTAFNLTCIVRLDVRADEEGNLFILEANPVGGGGQGEWVGLGWWA